MALAPGCFHQVHYYFFPLLRYKFAIDVAKAASVLHESYRLTSLQDAGGGIQVFVDATAFVGV
jgi:hypothetical protein